MNKLMDENNNLITREISNVLISYDSIKIRNRLLDGSYHVQTIGDPVKIISITCNTSEVGKMIIDESYNIDKPIRINWYSKFYTGYISENPDLSLYVKGSDSKRVYSVAIRMVVSEEGSI